MCESRINALPYPFGSIGRRALPPALRYLMINCGGVALCLSVWKMAKLEYITSSRYSRDTGLGPPTGDMHMAARLWRHQSVSQLFHGPAPRSPLHRLAVRLRHSRSNTSTEYSLPGPFSVIRSTRFAWSGLRIIFFIERNVSPRESFEQGIYPARA